MSDGRHSESTFETVIETNLLPHGYIRVDRAGSDRECAIFPETMLGFLRETQPTEWTKRSS